MRHLPILLLAFLPATAVAATADPDGVTTPFVLGPQGQIVVRVAVNGTGPHAFLVDTGASGSVITGDLQEALGAPAVARTTVTTPLGDELRVVARIDRIEIGGAGVAVLATVVPPGSFDGAAGVKGLIGQDVLASRRYTIDFGRRRIGWHEAALPPTREMALRLVPQGERFVVDLPQRARPLRLVPDTGAEALVLFDHGDGRLPPATVTAMAELSTVSARRSVFEVVVHALRVGSFELHDLRAVVLRRDEPRDEQRLVREDGLLPLHLFDQVTFDGPGRQLFLSR